MPYSKPADVKADNNDNSVSLGGSSNVLSWKFSKQYQKVSP